MTGQTISHYRVLGKLGEGGMGVVYKAEDTRLHRTVALKFLRTETVEDEEFATRFRHEAEAAAALIHPNICVVHEIDEADRKPFIAMEYVEGQSLKQKIDQRPLPLREALDIAVQVAEGLQAAHRKGIVHRDVKSSNIMIDADSHAKIMDFGLAHLAGGSGITKAGTVVGTPAYMSPEQVRGEKLDHRTDVWSLGVVLYEMVTGQLPFRGEEVKSMALAIQNSETEPLTAQRAGVPLELDWIVSKALAKQAGERYQHVEEISVDLRGLQRRMETETSTIAARQHGMPVTPQTTVPPPAPWRRAIPWVIAALAIFISALAIWTRRDVTASRPASVTQFSMQVPWKGAPWGIQLPNVAISPDGSRFVFVGNEAGLQQLYLREMDDPEAGPIAGTEDARNPFFAPDGESVAFLTSRQLKKVSLSTGAVATVCDVLPMAVGGSWGPDNSILFSQAPALGGLFQVSDGSGVPEVYTAPDGERHERGHAYPRMLPGGKGVLFTIRRDSGLMYDTRIAALSLDTGKWRHLTDAGTSPHFVPPRYLVFARAGALYGVLFDPERLETRGSPAKLLDGVRTGMGAEFSLSETGSLVYLSGTREWRSSRLVYVNRQGNQEPLDSPVSAYFAPRFSPDGRFVALSALNPDDGNVDTWIIDLERDTMRRLTSNPGNDGASIWLPDGKRIVTATFLQGTIDLFLWPADGSGSAEKLLEMEHGQFPTSCSPDGQTVLFVDEHPVTNFDIWSFPIGDESKPQPFVRTEFNEAAASFSPDGRWVAYQSDQSGRYEVYVRRFEGGGVTQVSTDGGREPVWAPQAPELFYRNGEKMMAVTVQTGPEFTASRPTLLFEGRYEDYRLGADYDVTADGQRFLMIKRVDQSPTTELRVVLNWTAELKRLLEGE